MWRFWNTQENLRKHTHTKLANPESKELASEAFSESPLCLELRLQSLALLDVAAILRNFPVTPTPILSQKYTLTQNYYENNSLGIILRKFLRNYVPNA